MSGSMSDPIGQPQPTQPPLAPPPIPPAPPPDPAPPVAVPPPSSVEPIWAKPSVSMVGLGIFVAGYIIAFMTRDATVQTMFAGAAIAMGQQVIGYWLGSSSGSAKKSEQMAANPPPAPANQNQPFVPKP